MQTFRDNAGRTWTVQVNVHAIKQVRAVLGIDLYAMIEDGLRKLGELLSDPVALVDVLYVLCRDEADKLGVSDEDFGRAMAGEAIERAADAFVEAFTDFFPNPRVRAGIRKVTDAGRAVIEELMAELDRRMAEVDVRAMASSYANSLGVSPASSASTPAR